MDALVSAQAWAYHLYWFYQVSLNCWQDHVHIGMMLPMTLGQHKHEFVNYVDSANAFESWPDHVHIETPLVYYHVQDTIGI